MHKNLAFKRPDLWHSLMPQVMRLMLTAQQWKFAFCAGYRPTHPQPAKSCDELDGSLPANPVNDRRTANAVTLKSTFCLP